MSEDVLTMADIVKIYPNGVVANNGVNFSVKAGEIHALVGENGAGKTTLMKILFGIEPKDGGSIFYMGRELHSKSPLDAINAGLGMVHQHFMLINSMTVAENIALGMESTKGSVKVGSRELSGFILDNKKILSDAKDIIQKYNFTINANDIIQDLPTGTRQKVEILKVLFRGSKLLILDEPTAVLTPQETKELFKQLKNLKDMGHTIIFISHKLNEIKEICDRITVMRSGKTAGVWEVKDVSIEKISALMVGQDIELKTDKTKSIPKQTVLEVSGLSAVDEAKHAKLHNINFTLRANEILGIVGVEGNGQRELVESITGLAKIEIGNITLNGKSIKNLNIKQIRQAGLSHIPQDRMERGAALFSSVEENLISVEFDTKKYSAFSLLKKQKIKESSAASIKNYLIKAASSNVNVKMLSGGNIQKVVVAREFLSGANCIIADQPTRGIDVGAASFIHKKLLSLRDEGAAVLLISSDMAEVFTLCDRIAVMFDGKIAAHFSDLKNITEEELGLYMLGIKQEAS
ncbi:MAG: guanosine ABC transporter ATP-binding protein NupO [Termitinemataceae bacterium]|nr:MAG: guanosine ABC transporter ATP-binding protein NupO [Termitinemataceae bacterium]